MRNVGVGTWVHRRRVKSVGTVAIVDGDVRRTYPELADRIHRLANALSDRGLGHGDRIAYLGPNSAAFLETFFAAGCLGAIFVPLNTRLAPGEVDYALADSGAALFVTDGRIGAESYEAVLESGMPGHRDLTVALDDPAAILYTSGTTGRPKGAILTHGNLTWNAMNVLVDYDVTSREVSLMVSPLFHAASLGMGALPTLLKGGTLVLQSKFDAAAVLAAIESERVTSLSGVPTTFQLLAEHPAWAATDLSSLEKLTCGGSAVPARVAMAYEERGLAFSSGYGLTETSPGATSLSALHSQTRFTSAGLAHFFTDVRVDAPEGEIGEVLISGPNVSPGYWGMPEASAVVDGWLHTGDLGVIDDDGFLTIADRAKDMYISGGENVYPAEVEQVIMELPAIEAVAVIGVPDERWGEVGRAVVLLAPGASLDHDELAAYLDGRIARYKIPRSTVVVTDLPRTASGKIRKQALRELYTITPTKETP